MKIALAQINPTVGDFAGNIRLILEFKTAPPAKARSWRCFRNCVSADTRPPTCWRKRPF